MKKLALGLTLAISMCAPPALAQVQDYLPSLCLANDMVKGVLKNFDENPIFVGSTQTQKRFYVMYNPTTYSWTMFYVNPKNDLSCVFASGKDGVVLEAIDPEAPSDPS